jgi:(2Fe-2S) ferredoxin
MKLNPDELLLKFAFQFNLGHHNLVAVRGCSHTGGHKYAGNVLVFVPENGVNGDLIAREGSTGVNGVWYGYVTPAEIPSILERTVCKGEVIPRLWRGSMGVKPDEHEAMAAAEAGPRFAAFQGTTNGGQRVSKMRP